MSKEEDKVIESICEIVVDLLIPNCIFLILCFFITGESTATYILGGIFAVQLIILFFEDLWIKHRNSIIK